MRDSQNILNNCWAKRTSYSIDDLGFTHIINDFDNNMKYLPLFKGRLRDQFIQEWNTAINNCPKLDFFVKFIYLSL